MPDARVDRSHRPSRRWSQLSMAATAIGVAAMGTATVWAGGSLGRGDLAEPGPGFWPTILGTALVVFGLLMLVLEFQLPAEPLTRRSWYVLAAVAACLVFVKLFAALGPTVPTFLLLLVWLKWLSRRSWSSSVVIAAAITLALYAVFVIALDISLPGDLLMPSR